MTETSPFTITSIHPRVARYLKRQEKRIQRQFWQALDHISAGPFPADDPAHIAHLKGPIEASAVNALSQSLKQTIAGKPFCILFDLSGVPYVSSTGWGQFAACYEKCQEWGGTVALYGLSPSLYDIYSCLEFHAFINAHPNLDDAMAKIKAWRDGSEAGVDDRHSETIPIDEPIPEEAETSFEFIDEDVDAVDDVLFDGNAETQPGGTAEETGTPVVERDPAMDMRVWPGDKPEDGPKPVRPQEPQEPTEQVKTPEAPLEDDEKRSSEKTFTDISAQSEAVDVDTAVTDKNLDKDEKLRDLGWGKYGEKLKKSGKHGKKKSGD